MSEPDGPDRPASGRPGETLDAIDLKIVAELQRDGRLSVRELAERVVVSRATAYARLDRLTRSGVILGFSAVIDPSRLGLGVSAYINVKIAQGQWRAVRDSLSKIEHVEHIAFVSGQLDLVLLVRARDQAELRDVVLEQLHGMPGVESTQTNFILDEVGWTPPRSANEPVSSAAVPRGAQPPHP
jgi:DNA-binding Lrp family transcriptional regulator